MHALWERTRKDGTSTVAVKLRLMRMGKKKQPTYRVVAADSRSPRDGRFIEVVGVYAPRGRSRSDRDAVVEIDDVKAMRWLSQGAKPTDRVERLLQQSGTWERFRNGLPPVVGGHGAELATGAETTGTGDPAPPATGAGAAVAGDAGAPGVTVPGDGAGGSSPAEASGEPAPGAGALHSALGGDVIGAPGAQPAERSDASGVESAPAASEPAGAGAGAGVGVGAAEAASSAGAGTGGSAGAP